MAPLTANEKLAEELAQNGLRATRQRIAVLRHLRRVKNHPTSAEVHIRLLPEHGNMSQKTVYMILDALVEASLVSRVTGIGDAQRYEAKQEPHFHATCRICERLYDVPSRADTQIQGSSDLPKGFHVENVEVTIVGVCLRCVGHA